MFVSTNLSGGVVTTLLFVVVDVTDNMNDALVALEQLPGPLFHVEFSTSLTT